MSPPFELPAAKATWTGPPELPAFTRPPAPDDLDAPPLQLARMSPETLSRVTEPPLLSAVTPPSMPSARTFPPELSKRTAPVYRAHFDPTAAARKGHVAVNVGDLDSPARAPRLDRRVECCEVDPPARAVELDGRAARHLDRDDDVAGSALPSETSSEGPCPCALPPSSADRLPGRSESRSRAARSVRSEVTTIVAWRPAIPRNCTPTYLRDEDEPVPGRQVERLVQPKGLGERRGYGHDAQNEGERVETPRGCLHERAPFRLRTQGQAGRLRFVARRLGRAESFGLDRGPARVRGSPGAARPTRRGRSDRR